jgi:1,6-anhydro-N-acetylmuramate kinase
MLKLFRPETELTGDERRWAVGVQVSSRCTQVSAALVGVLGSGYDMLAEVAAAQTAAIPRETTSQFHALSHPGGSHYLPPPAALASCRQQLAEIQAALVNSLVSSQPLPSGQALAVGVHDPGIWVTGKGDRSLLPERGIKETVPFLPTDAARQRPENWEGPPRPMESVPFSGPGYLSLSDPARLAELTGLNVIDAFPARDLVLGGQGGPVTAVAQWILLRSQLRHGVFLDLGRTVRLTYLPAGSAERAPSQVLAFDVGPGMTLLDLLVQRLTQGEQAFDTGGRLAVQGCRIPELIARWLADPYFERSPPRWHPQGVRPERFLSEALPCAVQRNWSVQDLLCTATCFLAEMVNDAVRRHLPHDRPVEEIIVAGGGVHNGFLLSELARLAPAPLVRLSDLPLPEQSLEAASAAVLALLSIDQVPASQTAISRTATPRLLGRFTPGSPQNWQRLLEACMTASQHARPLRAAM